MENNDIEHVTIYGYIALALKILTVPEDTSNRVRKEIDGYSAKLHGERINDFSCYLIGQLAKNSNISGQNIGNEMRKDCFKKIMSGFHLPFIKL